MYRSRYGGDLTYAKKFDSILHFFIPKETMKRLGKDGKPDRGEPETSVTFFFLLLFMGPSGAVSCSAAGAESSSGGIM
jgi:hypothetical protein